MHSSALIILATLIVGLIVATSPALAQGESAVPFLLITPSIDGNGMGGVGTSLGSDVATAPMMNPAQLGMFSLHGFLNGAFYTPKTDWLPEFHIPGLTYDAWAMNAGIRIDRFVHIPFGLSFGIGYSRVDLDLGRFTVTSSSGPDVIGVFEASEKYSNVTLGIGLEYVVQVSAGMSFKSVESDLAPVGTESEQAAGKAAPNAHDFGIMARLPVTDLIEKSAGISLEIVPKVRPLLDLGFGYSRCNIGDSVSYIAAAQADPLPRKAALGAYVEVGTTATLAKGSWKPFSFLMVREAEDILIERFANGSWKYTTGLGEINFVDNVLLGKGNPNLYLRRGWQFQACEIVSIRGGSVEAPGLVYDTQGYSISLGGVFKALMAVSPTLANARWFATLADLLDLQYTSASYYSTGPIKDTSFKGINVVIRNIPFAE